MELLGSVAMREEVCPVHLPICIGVCSSSSGLLLLGDGGLVFGVL